MKSESAENPLQQVRQYWTTVLHFKWWILLGTLAITLMAFTYIARMPDSYKATTTIQVDPQKIPAQFVPQTTTVDLPQRLSAISQTVLSTTRLQEIIEQMNLYPQMRKNSPMEQVIELMRHDITIEVKQGAAISTFTISYQSKSRELVAPVANQLASRFIDWNLAIRKGEVTQTLTFLTEQLEKAKQNLEQQESKLREFKMSHVGEIPEQQATNMQMLSQLNSQLQSNSDALNRLDIQRTMLLHGEGQPATAVGPRPVSERARLEAEKRQLEDKLADLRRKYTADFPDTVEASQRLDRVTAQLRALPVDPDALASGKGGEDNIQLSVINREMKRLTDDQKRIEEQIRMYRARVEASPLREQQMADLTRNYEVSKAEYESLLGKKHSAEMASDLDTNQQAERFTILDLARTPERPFKPDRRVMMFGSLFGALAVCIALAVAVDMVNPAIKTETDVRKILPATVGMLIAIPQIETAAERRRRLMFGALAIAICVLACCAELAFYWKVHPYL